MTHEIYLLPEDREYIIQRIAELESEIQGLGPEFQDVFTQSSETWHDNAPFDALRDKQSTLAAELDHLRKLLRHSTLDIPRKKRGTVGVGDTVLLDNGKRYLIAGDWTHKAGQHADGTFWVSCHTPIAKAVIGYRVGDRIEFGKVSGEIVEISS